MTNVMFKKVLNFLKNKLDILESGKKNRREAIVQFTRKSDETSVVGDEYLYWNKFAEININRDISYDGEIVFDVSDAYGIGLEGNTFGRLRAHVRVNPSNGFTVIRSALEWVYCNSTINFNNFVIAYKNYDDYVNVQLWTYCDTQYINRRFLVAYQYVRQEPEKDFWTLYQCHYEDRTDSLPEDYSIITSELSYSYALDRSALNKVTIGLQKKNLLENNCKSYDSATLHCKVMEDGSMIFNGSQPGATIFYWNIKNGATERPQTYANSANKSVFTPGKYIVSGGSEHISIQIIAADSPNVEGSAVGSRAYQSDVIVDFPDKPYVWARIYVNVADKIENEIVKPMIRPVEIADNTYEPYKTSIQDQINLIPKLKKLTITKTTSAGGNIQLTDGTVTLTRDNASVVSVIVTPVNGTAIANSLTLSNNNYFAHCFTADPNHTIIINQSVSIVVYYYDMV